MIQTCRGEKDEFSSVVENDRARLGINMTPKFKSCQNYEPGR